MKDRENVVSSSGGREVIEVVVILQYDDLNVWYLSIRSSD